MALRRAPRWADVPMNWTCPECGARKEDFEMVAV
jgi:rubredoxin